MSEIPAEITTAAAAHGYTEEDLRGAARFVASIPPEVRALYGDGVGPVAMFMVGLKHVRAVRERATR
jgi:hypothetical protein